MAGIVLSVPGCNQAEVDGSNVLQLPEPYIDLNPYMLLHRCQEGCGEASSCRNLGQHRP